MAVRWRIVIGELLYADEVNGVGMFESRAPLTHSRRLDVERSRQCGGGATAAYGELNKSLNFQFGRCGICEERKQSRERNGGASRSLTETGPGKGAELLAYH